MKIKYVQDTDTLHIEFWAAEVDEAQTVDVNTLLELDGEGRLCAMTIKHASDRIAMPSLKRVSGDAHGVLNLTADEQGWLSEYRRRLQEQFPGLMEDIIVYGPYARGISDPDVEWSMVMIIREGDRERKEELSSLAYDVDLDGRFFCSPIIQFYTTAEWAESNGSTIYKIATTDGVSVV